MSIQKRCADSLREYHRQATGEKLGAGHAHELVAAFFGYPTAAALQAEVLFPVANLLRAKILIPDLEMMDQRLQQLQGLPPELGDADELAEHLCDFLVEDGSFTGLVWQTRDLEDHIQADFIQKDPTMIENDLSGQIAVTNAYYDELYVDEIELVTDTEALVAHVSGNLNGENDPDKSFFGDSIAFTTVMTFARVAGRAAYDMPSLETSGEVDVSRYERGDEA